MGEPDGTEVAVSSSLPLLEDSSGGIQRKGSGVQERHLCDLWQLVIIPEQENRIFTFWEFTVSLLILISAYFVPFDVFILKEPEPSEAYFINRCFDCVFLADMVLTFFTAYEKADQHDGQDWETNKLKILSRYCAVPFSENGKAGWFWIDLLATGPGWLVFIMREVAPKGSGHHSHTQYHKVATLLRVLRLLRMLRLSKMLDRIQNWNVKMGFSLNGIEALKLIMVTFLIVHWMACLWVACEGKRWNGVVATLIDHQPDSTWLSAFEDNAGELPCDLNAACVWLLSLYWAIMTLTTVGYGDITPQNWLEFIICCITMLLMGFTWAYIVGSIVALISNLDKYGNEFKQQMDDLNDMCEDRDVPRPLRLELRQYLMMSKTIPKQKQQRELLTRRLSKTLNAKISEHTRGNILGEVWWAQPDRRTGVRLPDDAKLEIVSRMTRQYFGPKETPVRQHMMIFVKEGKIRVNFRTLTKGHVWGETNILMDQPDIILSKTESYVDSFVLTQEELKEAARRHPTLDVRLRRAQVMMAVWRGLSRVKISSYFTQGMAVSPAKQAASRVVPTFAASGSSANTSIQENSAELEKAVDSLAEQVKELRDAQQRAHDFAKEQLQVTRDLAEKVERWNRKR
jgi:hypothetical protein